MTHTIDTLPAPVKKFWKRRYALFEKFDEGIYLSSELWYSVTAESIAKYTANLFRNLLPNATSGLDLCCGGEEILFNLLKFLTTSVHLI